MNSIAQDVHQKNAVSQKMQNFFATYRIGQILRQANACKMAGVPAIQIVLFVFAMAFSRKFKMDIGKVKTANDIILVTLALIISYTEFGSIEGVREGTLIGATCTGFIARFFLLRLKNRISA